MRRPKPVPQLGNWDDLAIFNAEIARGIVHTGDWNFLMAIRQFQFDLAQEQRFLAEGWVKLPNNAGWIR